MTETTTPARTAAEIRADLTAVAPLPDEGDVPPLALARHLAVRALARAVSMLEPGMSLEAAPVMCAEFAAAMALYALEGTRRPGKELDLGIRALVPKRLRGDRAYSVATLIRDALDDGGEIGEQLFELLGKDDTGKVTALAGELQAAIRAAEAAEGRNP